MTLACERARAARARSRKPSSTSATTSSGASSAKLARASPRRPPRARRRPSAPPATKSWPSRLSPLMAKNASPGCKRAAVDRDAARRPPAARPRARARIAAAIASTVHSGRAHAHLPRKRRGDRLVIAERQHPVADDLAGFVALAGDQQHVAGLQLGDRAADRLARGRRSRRRPAPPRGSRRGSRRDLRCADCRR